MSDMTTVVRGRTWEQRNEHGPEWAIIDLRDLTEAQTTVGKLVSILRDELGNEHPATARMRRLKRELREVRGNAAILPESEG